MTGRRAAAVLLLALASTAPDAGAQVTTNTEALKGLGTTPPAPHRSPPHHPAQIRRSAPRGTRTAAPRERHATAATRPAGRAAPSRTAAPTMPAHPPPLPVIAPPAIHVPLHPPPPPPPVPVDPKARGTVSASAGGAAALDFGPGEAGLNASMMAAVDDATQRLIDHPSLIALIDSDASGSPDDPSMPRRLSLERALAIRAVMINRGVPSTRIFARANGLPPDGDPHPDRTTLSERDGSEPGAFAPPGTAERPVGPTPALPPRSASEASSEPPPNGAPSAASGGTAAGKRGTGP